MLIIGDLMTVLLYLSTAGENPILCWVAADFTERKDISK